MTVRIGFIGAGGIAEHHMNTLQRIHPAKITAIFDVNPNRAAEIADKYEAAAYASVEQLLDSGQVDAVFVCSPPFARDGAEVLAAQKGIAVLAEKPVALNMEQAKEWEAQILGSGVVHSSGYCLRYLDIVQKAKAYLQDKKISLVQAYRIGGKPPMAWWTRMEMSGGQLVEQSTHQLDLVRYLAGEISSVHAFHAQTHIKQTDPEATAYDVGAVSFVLASGGVGNITSTCLSNHFNRGEVEFFGPDFYLSINGNTLKFIDAEQHITEVSRDDFYYLQNKAFVEAVAAKRQDLVLGDYAEAVETLRVTLAANESADSGKAVAL
ncbi:Gfo/Idh/MocA family protein [Paenibacillus agaridevorans]|uniref:Gfo/Idh/MocA family protein n=1 Tax=Paenibacillus agaridevorans TaxID=171404 RepID=UPI001BE48999|nr:Gfo/Idh/MocA family oxidoreductase [Paenibacillus agaridevorans]